jgi:ABC-2 type transport system permease protein
MLAFIKKDFIIETSYKLSFLLTWCGMVFSIVTFYFIAKLFDKGAMPYLKEYGVEYFPFVLIGIAFSGYLMTSLNSFSANLRREQMMGTLEAMLMTPTEIPIIIISMSVWNFIFGSINIIGYILFGVLFFGINFVNPNFFGAFIILFLTIISFSSIGIISASFIMIFKRGDPITWSIGTFSSLFGGGYIFLSLSYRDIYR